MTTSTEFNIFVETVVRPIRVPTKRKRRMREELLAHMNGLQKELNRKDDLTEEQVVAETISRMGQPTELTEEFRGQENLWNRLYLVVENIRYHPQEKFRYFVLKQLIASMLAAVVVLLSALIMAYFVKANKAVSFNFIVQIAVIMACINFTNQTLFLLLTDRISRAVHLLQLRPSKLATICYFFLSLMLVPIIASIVYLVFSYNNDSAIFNTTLVVCGAPMIPILLLILSKQAAEEIKYYEQWADLEID